MAMSRLCALGAAVVLAQASGEFDYGKYIRQYAGGPRDGEFADYLKSHAKGFSGYGDKYAGNYSQDRIAEAKGYEQQYAGGYEERYAPQSKQGREYMEQYTQGSPASLAAWGPLNASGAAVLAEAPFTPANTGNATEDAEQDLAMMQSEIAKAKDVIARIKSWNADMKANLRTKSFALTVAGGIQTKVLSDFSSQQQQLNASFNGALEALNPRALARVNASVVKSHVDAAKLIIKRIRQLNQQERKEMRATLNEIGKAGKAKAKTLWKQAKVHAKQVKLAGKAAAKAQRKAGMHESVYERQEGKAERDSERLLGQAEQAAERAEGLIERQFGQVEHHVEKMIDAMGDEQSRAVSSLEGRLDRQEELVNEARRAAQEQPTQSPTEPPTVAFLARSSAQDQDLFGSALIVPLACGAMMAAMLTLAAARVCGRGASLQRPLLG